MQDRRKPPKRQSNAKSDSLFGDGAPPTESPKQRSPPQVLRLNLLENGLDFIVEGVEALYGEYRKQPEARAYKYTLLHIFSGTLLVLKERLRRAHPSLIFQKVHENGKPGAKTVDFTEVVDRLQGAANVKLEQADRDLLKKVQVKRNALEHYECDLELTEVNARVGELVDFLERFLHDELKESLLTHVSGPVEQELAELRGIAQRLRERRHDAWLLRIKPYRRITKKKLAELAGSDRYYGPKDHPPPDLRECPECGDESVVFVEPDIGICTVWECREMYMLDPCAVCGESAFKDAVFCRDCGVSLDNYLHPND